MANLTTASKLGNAELANLLGELTTARNPSWSAQVHTPNPPQTATAGVSLSDGTNGAAVIAHVQVRVRRVSAYRTAIYQITEANGQTYTLTFNGPVAAFPAGAVSAVFVADASATKQEIANGLKAAIEANATLNAALLAYSETDPTTGLYRLRVTGKPGSALGASDYIVVAATATGAGALVVSADPAFCRIIIWGFPGGDRIDTTQPADTQEVRAFADFSATTPAEESSPWLQVYLVPEPGAVPVAAMQGEVYVHSGGYLDRLNVAGLSRLCVQVPDVVGVTGDIPGGPPTYFNPRILIGPNRRESARPIGS